MQQQSILVFEKNLNKLPAISATAVRTDSTSKIGEHEAVLQLAHLQR